MISLAHPGSVLIDLLNAEIDCREAEQPYWSAAFIIHSGSRRGEERLEQEEKPLTGWPNSLLTGWAFTWQSDEIFVSVTDRLDTSVGPAVWPALTDNITNGLIGQHGKIINMWVFVAVCFCFCRTFLWLFFLPSSSQSCRHLSVMPVPCCLHSDRRGSAMNCSVMSVSIRAPLESRIRSISRTWKDPECRGLVTVCNPNSLLFHLLLMFVLAH